LKASVKPGLAQSDPVIYNKENMENKKIIKQLFNQIIGSTNIDSQGEKIPKRILEDLCEPGIIPLQQNHLPEKNSIGYISNLHLEQDVVYPDEWFLKGDITFTSEPDNIDLALGGFSWSITELFDEYKGYEDNSYALYISFPGYNDNDLLSSLAKIDPKLSLGRWYKKSADSTQVSLLVGFIYFLLGPSWGKVYDKDIWPMLQNIFSKITQTKTSKTARTDFVQLVKINENIVNIYFIPDDLDMAVSYRKNKIVRAINDVDAFCKNDNDSKLGYKTIKLLWSRPDAKFLIKTVEYRNGSMKSIIE